MQDQDTLPPPLRPRKKKTTAPRGQNLFDDPWRDWKPQWQDAQSGPHAAQEHLHPSEAVRFYDPAAGIQQECRRRIVDARLWDSLDATLQQAALEIAYAFEALGKGLGFATSNWQRVPGARNPLAAANGHARLSGAYVDWTRACHDAKVSHSMVIDVLCFGISCKALDRDRRVRSGMSRRNLVEGLVLYARLRGWRRG